ncbi:MAG: TIGR00730 family Rossman fold protein [Pyrinomonadaceae bacterium]
MKRVCVFCGSNMGLKPIYAESAKKLGKALVERNLELVYGGGRVGLMGVIAETVLELGGTAIGIIPESLAKKEIAYHGLNELIVVESMHKRKAMMEEFSDGFIALPGGFGTFEELCEMVTWGQLGFHRKPCGILNIDGFYDPLIQLFDESTSEGFIRSEHRETVLIEAEPEKILLQMEEYIPPVLPKWLDKDES